MRQLKTLSNHIALMPMYLFLYSHSSLLKIDSSYCLGFYSLYTTKCSHIVHIANIGLGWSNEIYKYMYITLAGSFTRLLTSLCAVSPFTNNNNHNIHTQKMKQKFALIVIFTRNMMDRIQLRTLVYISLYIPVLLFSFSLCRAGEMLMMP